MNSNLPIFEEGGPITIPNPKQFTFNPNAINQNALKFPVNTTATDLSGIIQVDQFKQKMELDNKNMQARLARDTAALATAQGRDRTKMADNILKSYKMDTAKVVKDLGLDRSNLRDREILETIDKTINDYTQQMTDVTLRYKANPNVLNSELAAVKNKLLEDINNTEGLAEQQDLNARMLAFQTAVTGREYNSGRAGEVVLDFVKYKNDPSGTASFDVGRLTPNSYLDTTASTFDAMTSLGKGLFTTKRSVESEAGYDFDVNKVISPDADKIEEVVNEVWNLAKNNIDFRHAYKGQIGDITSDDDLMDFSENFVEGFRREAEAGLGKRIRIGKTKGGGGDPAETLDTDGIMDALHLTDQSGKNAGGAAAEIRRRLKTETPEDILNDSESVRKIYNTKVTTPDPDDPDGGGGEDSSVVSYTLPNGSTITRVETENLMTPARFNGKDIGLGMEITEKDGEKVLKVPKAQVNPFAKGGSSDSDRAIKLAELLGTEADNNLLETIEATAGTTSDKNFYYVPLNKKATSKAKTTGGVAGPSIIKVDTGGL